ncbi:uncharacterized protein EI90DRAFT_832644 [Cantharellus anzutake]|uniref:uncharacterized protein n=1 Tax=Cantharellus anzutake TaxID=1750568 RepID=UPI001903049F|nr:uncharacterized protein EI90DRAFT_832644 [Cantharellus anzutake]KAF8343134.1 hypothetical protein EI90DRAFT_832644 [Cantharellus anzutake]
MNSTQECGEPLTIEHEITLQWFTESIGFRLKSDLIRVGFLEGASPYADSLSGAMEYLRNLRSQWNTGKLGLPSNWMFSKAQLEQPIISLLEEEGPFVSQLMVGATLAPIQHMLSPLTPEEVDSRYDSPVDLQPDFLLSTARVFFQPHWTTDERRRRVIGYLNRDTRYASSQLHSLLMHNGGDVSFGDMVIHPQLCFPEEFQPSQPPDRIHFCIVRHLITPLMADSKRVDQHLPVSFSNPALITGAFESGSESVSSETLENVFHVVRGSLASLMLASFVRQLTSPRGSGFWSKVGLSHAPSIHSILGRSLRRVSHSILRIGHIPLRAVSTRGGSNRRTHDWPELSLSRTCPAVSCVENHIKACIPTV